MQDPPVLVACLCAAWCRLCDDYADVFARAAAQAGTARLTPLWIDIEDDDELVGDLDVETFPTVVVVDARDVRFAGPLEPQPETLQRLLRATVAAGPAQRWPAVADDMRAFAQRLRQRHGLA